MNLSEGFKNHYSALGLQGLAMAACARVFPMVKLNLVRTPLAKHAIYLRIRKSDVGVFKQIFIDREYDFPVADHPRVIVDAGANVGLTSVFFANKFPQARIFSMEPDAENFVMLVRNVSRYPQITPIWGALWHCHEMVGVTHRHHGSAGLQVHSTRETGATGAGGSLVKCFTIPDLVNAYSLDRINLLKVDIEGSERDIFATSAAWIDAVDTIFIELHDRYTPGCSEAVFAATKDFPVREERGEIVALARSAEAERKSA
jgi:FkbM family methyltransferase